MLVTPGTSALLYEQLLNQEIDAAILVEPNFTPPKLLHAFTIVEQPLCVISKHSSMRMSLEDLIKNNPFILYDRNSWGGQIVWQWVRQQKPSPKILCELDSLETIAIMTEQDLGFSVVPKWSDLCERYDVAIHPLPNEKKFTRTLALYSNRASAVQSLIHLIRENLRMKQ